MKELWNSSWLSQIFYSKEWNMLACYGEEPVHQVLSMESYSRSVVVVLSTSAMGLRFDSADRCDDSGVAITRSMTITWIVLTDAADTCWWWLLSSSYDDGNDGIRLAAIDVEISCWAFRLRGAEKGYSGQRVWGKWEKHGDHIWLWGLTPIGTSETSR